MCRIEAATRPVVVVTVIRAGHWWPVPSSTKTHTHKHTHSSQTSAQPPASPHTRRKSCAWVLMDTLAPSNNAYDVQLRIEIYAQYDNLLNSFRFVLSTLWSWSASGVSLIPSFPCRAIWPCGFSGTDLMAVVGCGVCVYFFVFCCGRVHRRAVPRTATKTATKTAGISRRGGELLWL